MNDNDKKIVYLYRHGETDWNIFGKTMGQLEGIDTKFTDLGYEEIYNISKRLEEDNVEVIYTSDFKRTMETARMANIKKVPIVITKKVRGLNMGIYQGLSIDELKNSDSVKLCFESYDIPFPNGESINDLNNRIINFIKEVCKETKYKRIAIITHSAAISNLKSHLLEDKYISLNMCTLLYKEDELSVLNYSYANPEMENKALVNRGKL